MSQPWELIFDFALLSVFLIVAVAIRRFVPFFSRFRIPDSIVAGILAILFGRYFWQAIAPADSSGIIGFLANNAIPWNTERLAAIVYHLMAIGFIALSLKREEIKNRTRSALSGGFYMVASYAIQGFIGLGITVVLIKLIYPQLFPSFGFLLPFGFAQGPGLAGGMGKEWEALKLADGSSAFPFGTSMGFSFSTLGFLWACFIGVPLMNILLRRRAKRGEAAPAQEGKPAGFLVEKERDYSGMARSIDKATTQLMLVGGIYLVLFFLLKGITGLLTKFIPGTLGQSVSAIFWGFQFGFGALLGTLVGKLIAWLEKKKVIAQGKSISNYILQHIGGISVDFMIAASIAAIDFRVFKFYPYYIFPLIIISTMGGLATIGYTWFFVKKVWPKTFVEHFVAFFGTHTGTLATGMGLLRGVDPQFRTSAASDLVYGSGIALLLGMPLIFMAGLPAEGFLSGKHNLYWITLLLILAYLVLVLAVWFLIVALTRRKAESS